ncbi:hypothetical protein [Luteimonas saliphila]|uniref:hypothetical protein n=1 Tax=Luteimonas saliphila TaxID=2804919 RepID=UPI00192E171B|nr:hypothetical protein [Luteimonas saliphila]
MNVPEAEILLAVALVALYLQDSALLLHFDEVLVEGGGRGWRVSTGSGLELQGRFLLVPNPLLPMRTRFRASWLRAGTTPAETADSLARYARTLWPVRIGSALTGVVVLGAMPYSLLGSRDPLQLLAALAAAWLLIIAMFACLALRRATLQLSRRQLGKLALESLLCPPHAINLYRRLCAMRGFRSDPVAFAATHLPADARRRLQTAIEARLDLFAQADEGAGGRISGLAAARARIAGQLA